MMPQEICEEYSEYHFEEKFDYFVDNSSKKIGTIYVLYGKEIPILSVRELLQNITMEDVVLITSKYYVEIYEQLEKFSELKNVTCYVWPAVAPQYPSDSELSDKIIAIQKEKQQIPKKIHYFWFGKNPIPPLEQKCIDSWKRICPDYEIVLWNEDNYDISKNFYMKQAYEAGKWGFASDYARLDIVYQYGGIYLDTDVEILRPLDRLLYLSGFMGFESKSLVAMGLGFGAVKECGLIKKLRDDYDMRSFKREDGSYDLTACPFLQTEVLKKCGLKMNNCLQVIEDVAILPAECFSPDNNQIPHITDNTFSIHHFSGSWTSNENKKLLEKMRIFAQRV